MLMHSTINRKIASVPIDLSKDAACAGYWKFGEAYASTTCVDSSGNGNTLTLGHGTVAFTKTAFPGMKGARGLFTNGSLIGPATGSLNINGVDAQLTIIAKISRKSATMINAATYTIASKYDNILGNYRQYNLNIIATSTTTYLLRFATSSLGSDFTSYSSTVSNLSYSKNYNVCVTYDGVHVKFYVKEIGLLADADNCQDSSQVVTTPGLYNAPSKFIIGSRYNDAAAWFTGYIDDLAVFSRALTGTELASCFNNGVDGKKGMADLDYYCHAPADTTQMSQTNLYLRIDWALASARPGVTAITGTGLAADGQNIRGILITPAVYHKTVMIVGGVHGDEQAGSQAVAEFLDDITVNVDKYPNTRFVIVVMANPSGFVDNTRKNDGPVYDVDLNRNTNVGWGGGDASDVPTEDGYKGPSAMSETETQWLCGLIDTYEPDIFFDAHEEGDYYSFCEGMSAALGPALVAHHVSHGFSSLVTYYKEPQGGFKDYAYAADNACIAVVQEMVETEMHKNVMSVFHTLDYLINL